jgi:hypothetical protein
MSHRMGVGGVITFAVLLAGGLLVWAQDRKESQESERAVQASEVPAAALAALKQLAGSAAITEFAEEIEHGHKFYEGSWKGPEGDVDALVTETGDVVEIEQKIPAAKAPSVVRTITEKEAGKDAAVTFERKTLYLYEIHFKKDGKTREMIFTADGRPYHEQPGKGKGDEDSDEDG